MPLNNTSSTVYWHKNPLCVPGKVQSTEETYKYHMQIQESSGEVSPDPGAKQAPLKTRLKPSKKLSYGHNKSGSTASTHSQESAKENHDPEPQEPATEETQQKESNDTAAADNTEWVNVLIISLKFGKKIVTFSAILQLSYGWNTQRKPPPNCHWQFSHMP